MTSDKTPPVTGPHVSPYGSFDCSKNVNHDGTSNSSKHANDGLSMHAQNQTSSIDSTHQIIAEATHSIDDECAENPKPTNDSHPNHPAHQEHLQKTRQYYRDMMLGVNDGLVSALLLVAGVVGGGMDVTAVLLTAVSGAIAGAISMFAGEYIATKSQNEVMRGVSGSLCALLSSR